MKRKLQQLEEAKRKFYEDQKQQTEKLERLMKNQELLEIDLEWKWQKWNSLEYENRQVVENSKQMMSESAKKYWEEKKRLKDEMQNWKENLI